MKKIIILVCVMAVSMAAVAKERTKSEMLQIATQQLQENALRNAQGASMNKKATSKKVKLMMKKPTLSVYGYKDGGFVIVSSDDRFPAVLGESDSKFDEKHMAPGFSWWLNAQQEAMRNYMATGETPASSRLRFAASEEVNDFMLKTKWDQGYPYNIYTPIDYRTSDTKYVTHTFTGCTNTALAQLFHYYNMPTKALYADSIGWYKYNIKKEDEKKAYYFTVKQSAEDEKYKADSLHYIFAGEAYSADFKDTANVYVERKYLVQGERELIETDLYLHTLNYDNIDHSKMKDVYSDKYIAGSENADSCQEVAKLMMACGVLSNACYSAFVMTATSGCNYAINALKQLDIDKKSLNVVERDFYNAQEWINMLRTELDAKRPVVYRGESKNGGHLFVVDGYVIKDNLIRFHLNYGWGGYKDGTYDLTNLNPSKIPGIKDTEFIEGQNMMIGFTPSSKPANLKYEPLIAIDSLEMGYEKDSVWCKFKCFNCGIQPDPNINLHFYIYDSKDAKTPLLDVRSAYAESVSDFQEYGSWIKDEFNFFKLNEIQPGHVYNFVIAVDRGDYIDYARDKKNGKISWDLQYRADVARPGIYINEDLWVDIPTTPTGIEDASLSAVNNQQSTVMYNLNGMRVGENYKGIVISNGKKYILK